MPSIEDEQDFWKQIYATIIALSGHGHKSAMQHANDAITNYRELCQKQDQQRRQEHAMKHL